MDIKELRQEFEKLPDIKGILYGSEFGFNESLNEYYHPDHTNHRLNYAFIMGAWMAWKAQAVPEGFVLIKDDTKTVVAIERMVEQQVEASGMDSRRLERLDGWKIIEAAVKAQEPQITELKVEWASDCFKCGHHEAIIYSTSAEASTKGWFHDGDEVKCTGCGNTGEMDTHGEDSDICWNEDEAND